MRDRNHEDFQDHIRHIYEETAGCLAADRHTKTLPVFFAELFFILGFTITLYKATLYWPSASNWPNVEAHSLAFSWLYLWVTGAVVIGGVIGVSQTENSVPRLLQQFEYHISEFHQSPQPAEGRRPSAISRQETRWCKIGRERAIAGGVYSWKPKKWKQDLGTFKLGYLSLFQFALVALIIVGASFATAFTLSYTVPKAAVGCRHIPQTLMFVCVLLHPNSSGTN